MDIWVISSFRWLKRKVLWIFVYKGSCGQTFVFSSVNTQEGNCFILFALLRGSSAPPISVISLTSPQWGAATRSGQDRVLSLLQV